ncbi:MAG: hypothetical protein PVH57_08510 [Syntrophobacterales bacterium]
MPRFDGTGPGGMGPMMGRGRGFCAMPVRTPGYNRPSLLPWRRGAGYGDRRYDSPSPGFMGWRGFCRGGGRGRFRGGGLDFERTLGRRWR